MTLDEALERRKTNRAELARALGISAAAVYKWDVVPQRRAEDVRRLLGLTPAELLALMGVGGES